MEFALNKEQKDIVKAAREFAAKEFTDVAQDFDRNESFDSTLWKKACELGFVGVFIDEKYEGIGYGHLEQCLIAEEFFAVDPGIGMAILFSCFGAELLDLFGTEDQKRMVLPGLVSGQVRLAMAIMESESGVDIGSLETTAANRGDYWEINGKKSFVTGGDVADYICVLTSTGPEDSLPERGLSFLMVPADTPGLSTRRLRGKLGIRAAGAAELSFSSVRVPASNLIGKPGEGFDAVSRFFGRIYPTVAAMAVGTARAAMEEALSYTNKRHAFGVPISSFRATQGKLMEMATKIRAARNLYYEAAWSVDNGIEDSALSAMARRYAGEVGVRCADEALQMHGGYGYIDEYKVQRIYRDAKVLEIWEGVREMERYMIGRAVGWKEERKS